MAERGRQPVSQGGMWNAPKATYSKETQNLLKEMMKESKLTNFQQRQIGKVMAGGGALPSEVNPTSSAPSRAPKSSSRGRQQNRVLNPRNTSAQIRTKDTIESSGAYERDKYVPGPPSLYTQNKEKFVNKMIYGEDEEPSNWRERVEFEEPEPVPKKDRFEELQDEINERRQFLSDMYSIGKGKQYQTIINTEISQLIREMEVIDKKRTNELSRLIEADKKQHESQIPKPDLS